VKFILLEEEADEAIMRNKMENGRINIKDMEDRKKQKTRIRKEDHRSFCRWAGPPPPPIQSWTEFLVDVFGHKLESLKTEKSVFLFKIRQ
jgi:hypothetical protein